MKAISSTLPPPPRPPVPFNGNGTGSYNNSSSMGNFRPTPTIVQLPPVGNNEYEIHYYNVTNDSYSYSANNGLFLNKKFNFYNIFNLSCLNFFRVQVD